MFTGIITNTGKVEEKGEHTLRVSMPKKAAARLMKGGSVAVNGACLTVVTFTKTGSFSADIMPETWERTMLGTLKKGDTVNLEFPLRASDGLDGHFVQGHVDGTATLKSISEKGESKILSFTASTDITKYLVEKGSIAINGISLTLIGAHAKGFSVGIIPHTWENTNLKYSSVGDRVNVEVDILAKYAAKLITKKK